MEQKKNNERYASVVCEIIRDGSALTFSDCLSQVKDENDESFMHVLSANSIYYVSLMKKDDTGKAASAAANIPAKDIDLILRRTNMMFEAMFLKEDKDNVSKDNVSTAYTQKILMGKFQGKTPAQILLETPEAKPELKNQADFLKKNMEKYKNNKFQVVAIEDAIKLFDEGKLVAGENTSAASSERIIYNTPTKYFKNKKNEKGYNKIYQIKITCDPDAKSPYKIEIMNCFAPVLKNSKGMTPIAMDKAEDMVRLSLSMTENEFVNVIDDLSENMHLFKQMVYSNMYSESKKRRTY